MIRHFSYPVRLIKQKNGYLVRFKDFPEAITQGDKVEDALISAVDCLEEAIANRIAMKLAIPVPSRLKKNQHCVSLHVTMAAKTALYIAVQDKKLSHVSLAKKLHCDEKEVRRLLDPHYHTKLPRLEYALHILGQQLEIGISKV